MITNQDRKNQILHDLLGAINSIRLYSDGHPQVELLVDRLMERLYEVFQTEDRLHVGVFNDSMLVEQKPVVGMGKVSKCMARVLNEAGVDQIVFLKGLKRKEFSLFLMEMFGTGTIRVMPSCYSHILVGKIATGEDKGNDSHVESVMDLDSSKDFIQMIKNLDLQKPFNFNTVRNLSTDLIETFSHSVSPLKYLAEIKSEDEYTYVHTINVALLSMSLAKRIGIAGTELLDIIYAALMHDVGKILVPKEILNKTGPLTPDEFETIKSHTVKGVMYLCNQKGIHRIAILAALEHHIKFNGGGYPVITQNWKPHFVSQIISIADIYDALRSNRPYREQLGHEQILGILRNDAGTGLNPRLVDAFIDMVGSGTDQ